MPISVQYASLVLLNTAIPVLLLLLLQEISYHRKQKITSKLFIMQYYRIHAISYRQTSAATTAQLNKH